MAALSRAPIASASVENSSSGVEKVRSVALIPQFAPPGTLFVPAVAVALGQCENSRWPPAAGRIRRRHASLPGPGFRDVIDPRPGHFGFVTPHEKRTAPCQCLEQEPFIGDTPP